MIYLGHVKPIKPAEFQQQVTPDQPCYAAYQVLERARKKVSAIKPKARLKSEDFNRLWSNYKRYFLRAQFKGKCAYCDSFVVAGQHGDVEHYRPKAQVEIYEKRGNRNDLEYKPERGKARIVHHSGYWWLAYDWDQRQVAAAVG